MSTDTLTTAKETLRVPPRPQAGAAPRPRSAKFLNIGDALAAQGVELPEIVSEDHAPSKAKFSTLPLALQHPLTTTDFERRLLDTPPLARLDQIGQNSLGLTSCIYGVPGLITDVFLRSRLDHSVNEVLRAMDFMLQQFKGILTPEEIFLARLVSLTHDDGHVSMSHLTELAFPGFSHDVAFQRLWGPKGPYAPVFSCLGSKGDELRERVAAIRRASPSSNAIKWLHKLADRAYVLKEFLACPYPDEAKAAVVRAYDFLTTHLKIERHNGKLQLWIEKDLDKSDDSVDWKAFFRARRDIYRNNLSAQPLVAPPVLRRLRNDLSVHHTNLSAETLIQMVDREFFYLVGETAGIPDFLKETVGDVRLPSGSRRGTAVDTHYRTMGWCHVTALNPELGSDLEIGIQTAAGRLSSFCADTVFREAEGIWLVQASPPFDDTEFTPLRTISRHGTTQEKLDYKVTYPIPSHERKLMVFVHKTRSRERDAGALREFAQTHLLDQSKAHCWFIPGDNSEDPLDINPFRGLRAGV